MASGNQTHRIKRLLFELDIGQQEQARHLHTEVSRICRHQVVPILERCLGKSGTDRLYRIDQLELDLGRIDPENLEQGILQELERELNRVLPDQLKQNSGSQAGIDTYIQSRLELLEVYARQGHLPWWAEQGQSEPISGTMAELLDKAPQALLELMPSLIRDERALQRIESRCETNLLIQLGKILCPPQAGVMPDFPTALIELLNTSVRTGGHVKLSTLTDHPRRYVWQSLLNTAVSLVSPADNLRFWREVLLRIAVITGMRYEQIVTGMYHSLEQDGDAHVPSTLAELLTTLYREFTPLESAGRSVREIYSNHPEFPNQANKHSYDTLHPGVLTENAIASGENTEREEGEKQSYVRKRVKVTQDATTSDSKATGNSSNDVTNSAQGNDLDAEHQIDSPVSKGSDGWSALLRLLQLLANPAGPGDPPLERHLHEQVEVLVRDGEAPAAGMVEKLSHYQSVWQAQLGPIQQRSLEALLQKGLPLFTTNGELAATPENRFEKITPQPVFSSFEEAYVENAGLVILGPFLERFFTRQELLVERRFRSDAAAQRAVSLLQYLVTEDPLGPEYLLPLNKVLCGIEPNEVFDDDTPLQEQEKAECEQLLQAVIEHASILRKMSVNGFRGSFLLRKGLLETRDGAWLLRVERESFDVVLDRFPWSFSWLKLPWMKTSLRVEW